MAKLGEITGKTFLITGGASGLGALYAEAFLREGAKHVTILDIAEATGIETTKKLNKTYPGSVTFIKCDVQDEESLSRCFNEVVNTVKQLDVLVNNAGILNDAPAIWRKACDVNYQGLVSLTMKALKHMRKDEGGAGGTIVNISSTAGIFPVGSIPIYCGAKAAVLHFSQSLSQAPFEELTGIRVLTICFGPTDTPLMQNMDVKIYTDKIGEEHMTHITDVKTQRPKSAVDALITMFRTGANGSVWLSDNDEPVREVTSKIHAYYASFAN